MSTRALYVRDLVPDEWVVLDPLYGPEKVLDLTRFRLDNGVTVAHMHVRGPVAPDSRFVVRGMHEPILGVLLPDRASPPAGLPVMA